MSPASSPPESRTIELLGGLFILLFFAFFSYHALFAYFTFDDGTTVIACLHPFETPFWRDILHILTVFTSAFRPLTTLFWRPLYAAFGFNPLPYRIVVHVMLTINIALVYVWARRLQATREAAALAALIFCYNASTLDLYYNTCLIGDIQCFLLYGLAVVFYVRGRQAGNPLTGRAIAAVAIPFLLAMDAKEQAVTLPGVLFLYELVFRLDDFRDKRKALRVGAVLAAMLVADAVYLKVKVADMSQNSAYNPHVTVQFILANVGHYLQQLLYLPENSVTILNGCLMLAGLLALGALLRSPQAIFGVLFFVASLIPVAVIPPRAGYAAYIPYFGLSLALGALLAGARSLLAARLKRPGLRTATAVILFLCMGGLLGWAHMVNRMPGTGYYEWSNPGIITLMENFERTFPEFPPNTRILLTDDPWGPDWGPMFLVRLLYHDNSIWVDRPKNMTRPPDPAAYDLVISYRQPDVDLSPARFLKMPMKWEIRGKAAGPGQFLVSSPNAPASASHIHFAPSVAKGSQTVTVTVPGLSNVTLNAIYRIVTDTKSTPHTVNDWCKLDAEGTCKIPVPSAGARGEMRVDWIQPVNQRWIFTSGAVTLLE